MFEKDRGEWDWGLLNVANYRDGVLSVTRRTVTRGGTRLDYDGADKRAGVKVERGAAEQREA